MTQASEAATETTLVAPADRDDGNPTPELLSALAESMRVMPMAGKSGDNTFDKYKYGTLEDYLKAIREPVLSQGLVYYSRMRGEPKLSSRNTKKGGTELVARVLVETRVMHPQSGGWLAVSVWGEGQDRGDKAIYKALTGGRKYSIAMLFGIYTSDDPEIDGHDEPKAPQGSPAQPPPPPPAPPTEWSEAMQGKLLAQTTTIGLADPSEAIPKCEKAIDYIASRREVGMTDPQFQDAINALVARMQDLKDQGHLPEGEATRLLALIASTVTPTSTAAAMPAAEPPAEQPTEEAPAQ